MIIAATYFSALIMVGSPDVGGFGVLNPAIALTTAFVMTFGGVSYGMKWFWIYLSFPFLGAIIGIIFHELLYKQVQDSIEEAETKDDGLLDTAEQEQLHENE